MPNRRHDSVGESLSVAAQGRGLEGTAGAAADLPPLRAYEPRLARFADRSLTWSAKGAPVQGSLGLGAPRLRFGLSAERLADLLVVAPRVERSFESAHASTTPATPRWAILRVPLADALGHQSSPCSKNPPRRKSPGVQVIPASRSSAVTPSASLNFTSVSMRGMRPPRSNRPTSVRCNEARKLSTSWVMSARSRARAKFSPKRAATSIIDPRLP